MPASFLAWRAQEFQRRQLVRQWEYRQRDLARGVWFRLRRVLAGARAAYAISGEDAAALEAEGVQPASAGREVAPPLMLYFVPEDRLLRLRSARALAVRLSAELLSTKAVALVPFVAADAQVDHAKLSVLR
jgi:hypothetical protein